VLRLGKVLQSPFTLKKTLLTMIEREARQAAAGRPARIVAKMNSLSSREVIRALYRASQAGVQIDLIVRGICCLRPGVPGVSENIRVRSVVGRFLEHTRIFLFHAGGEEQVWCASADWMSRNLDRRVETCFPVLEPRLAERVRAECLEVYLEDNVQAWELGADGVYRRVRPGAAKPRAAQEILLERLCTQAPEVVRAQRTGPARSSRKGRKGRGRRRERSPARDAEALRPVRPPPQLRRRAQ
jgi:polyphosphate kinase